MDKLKTLKDIEAFIVDADTKEPVAVKIEELKKETIKWVKFYEGEVTKGKISIERYETALWFINNFFDITEEDLEDE